jgi:hypothetical protein
VEKASFQDLTLLLYTRLKSYLAEACAARKQKEQQQQKRQRAERT